MDKHNSEANPQNNIPQMNQLDNQNQILQNNDNNCNIPQSTMTNPHINPSELNIPQNTELSSQPQIENLIPNNNNINPPISELNLPQIENKTQEMPNQPPQIDALNQMNLPETVELNPQQFNEQYMAHFQNQLPPMSNNPDIPMNGYMLNYPQIPNQVNQEQNDGQQNGYHETKNIYDYSTNMRLFGIAFQNGNSPRLAISSLEKRLDNKIEILELFDNDLKKVFEMLTGYPCTKLLWRPNKTKN